MKTFKHLINAGDASQLPSNEVEPNHKFSYADSRLVEKPAFKCIHECCKRLRKSESKMLQLGQLMDSVTLIGASRIPFKFSSGTTETVNNYRFNDQWIDVNEPLDLSIKVVRS